ncbi:MAG: FAD-binding oxidoreductase [Gemmatimonadota bacterium]|nr:FAD-binding oxidoreductase [Gemmatimonadota bacterium]
MDQIDMTTLDGGTTSVGGDALEALADALDGDLVTPDSPDFDESRELWNAMIDRRPGAIVECATANDARRAVDFARAHDLLVTIRGCGHNIAGNASADGALMISFSGMKAVNVDAATRRVRVEPGASLGDLDAATQAHGLAVPVGINSTTGIAGLTLGGGFGWLSRAYGMTVDSLVSVDLVTASGAMITASAAENDDLFWGLRGGGGNFGVVTSFEFEAHPVGPQVMSGLLVHPAADARDVLLQYREIAAAAPDELSIWVVLRQAPPLPFLPEDVHFEPVLVLAALYAGDMEEGERAFEAIRAVGNPIADAISPHVYTEFQAAFDGLLTPGARNYWKSHDFLELSDGLIDVMVAQLELLPGFGYEIFLAQMGGATNRVPADATAYPHRDVEFIMNVHGRWEDADEDEAGVAWCRAAFDAAAPFATGGVYTNFMTAEETGRIRDAYGSSWDRLVALKNRYDPDNFFRMNQNIRPASTTG